MNGAEVILLLAGLVVGGLAGYLVATRKGREAQARADAAGRIEAELRDQIQQRTTELDATREKLSTEQKARAAAETAATRLPALEEAASKAQADLAAERAHAAQAEAEANAAEERLTEQQRQHTQALADLRAAQEKAVNDLREAFAALSAKALKETQPEFLRLANETFAKLAETAKGDLKARQEAIAGVVAPLKEQLEAYQRRLQASEQAQSKTLGEVSKQLEGLLSQSQTLASETNQLRRILSSNQARGRWGEATLRRVVEAAGMSPHCDFLEQAQVGDAKPDMVVKLPGDRVIIVDSKVPDIDFLSALGTADETKRSEILSEHAAKLKSTIKDLAARNYPKAREFSNALDKVVLFVPAESLLSAALEGDRDLIVYAAEQGILLATPSSLLALLYAVAMSWQQHAQTENARKIADAALELFSRIRIFVEHFGAIRDGLEKAAGAYNRAVGSYESRIMPGGERLLKLSGAPSDAALPDAKPAETVLRSLPDAKNP